MTEGGPTVVEQHAFMRAVGARHDPVRTDLAMIGAVSFLAGR